MFSKSITLMYHGIVQEAQDIPPEREAGAALYDVSLEKFQAQMNHLKKNDFSHVIVTFDDGEENNFRHALPILQEMKCRAYFFVTVNRVGTEGYMNWEQIKEMRDAGMIIGSHGMNHAVLTELKSSDLEEELMGSKDILEKNLNLNVNAFSIPRGFYNEDVIRVAQEAGYHKIFSSNPKPCPMPLMARTAVKGSWDLHRFQMALRGKTPLGEKLFGVLKDGAKKVAGPQGYNAIRGRILK